jgi:hypothetical protein
MKHLSAEPLVLIVTQRGGLAQLGAGKGANSALRQAFYRAKKRGFISMEQADDLCVQLLGCHPVQIWGDAWIACALAD